MDGPILVSHHPCIALSTNLEAFKYVCSCCKILLSFPQVTDPTGEQPTAASLTDPAELAPASLFQDYRQQPPDGDAHAAFPGDELESDYEDSIAVWMPSCSTACWRVIACLDVLLKPHLVCVGYCRDDVTIAQWKV